MRIRKDATSWHASGVLARDARHDRSTPETPKGQAARKDTRRWCRGKVGREHVRRWDRRYVSRGYVCTCANCGKHLDWCGSWFNDRCHSTKHGHDADGNPRD